MPGGGAVGVTPILDMVRRLRALGAGLDIIEAAIECAEAMRVEAPEVAILRERRERDRARKSAVRGNSADVSADPPPEVPSPQTPQPPNPPPVPPSPPTGALPPRSKRAARLPDGWKPSDSDREYGRQLGLAPREIDDAAEEMRLWAGGNGAAKADWSLTFKGWMRRNVQRRPASTARATGPPVKRNAWAMIHRMATEDGEPHQHENGFNGPGPAERDPRAFPDGREAPQRGQVLDLEPIRDRRGAGPI